MNESTSHVGIAWKMGAALNVYKIICLKSTIHVVINVYELYLSFSCVFISNQTNINVTKHC